MSTDLISRTTENTPLIEGNRDLISSHRGSPVSWRPKPLVGGLRVPAQARGPPENQTMTPFGAQGCQGVTPGDCGRYAGTYVNVLVLVLVNVNVYDNGGR